MKVYLRRNLLVGDYLQDLPIITAGNIATCNWQKKKRTHTQIVAGAQSPNRAPTDLASVIESNCKDSTLNALPMKCLLLFKQC